jgi:hypothetical protein
MTLYISLNQLFRHWGALQIPLGMLTCNDVLMLSINSG